VRVIVPGWVRVRFGVIGLAAMSLSLALIVAACGGGGGDTSGTPSEPPAIPEEEGATLVVSSDLDTVEQDGVLTLREALLLATGELSAADLDEGEKGQVDGNPGAERADTVLLDESIFSTQEPGVITLTEELPVLSTGGDSVNGMGGVVVDGGDRSFNCFTMDSDGNTVTGMEIRECRTGVRVAPEAAANVIGEPEGGNVLSGNRVGAEVGGRDTVVAGNIIGLEGDGITRMSNAFEGIWVTSAARDTRIGGTDEGEGNVISGNELFGVSVDGANGTVIYGNIIGLDASGATGVGNYYGIVVQKGALGTVVGGSGERERNVISDNNTGILVRGVETAGNEVVGNYIGTDVTGKKEVFNTVDVWLQVEKDQNVFEDNFALRSLVIREEAP
jgi:hypothetical protein